VKDLEGRVAVVTGGASGVGRALVTQLAEGGARVVMADIDSDALEAEAEALRGRGLAVQGVQVDVTRVESVEALAARVFETYGNVHLLFNNAGVGIKEASRPLWTIPAKDWEWGYAVNVMGAVNGIRAFVPTMLERGEPGHVINTSSSNGGIYSLPTTPVYASSKAALTSLTEVLHQQFLRAGAALTAHLLFPGPHLVNTNILNSDRVRTERFRAEGSEPAAYVDMKSLAERAGVEFKLTEPEEVAEMALRGVREGRFWILSELGTADQKLRTRTDEILARKNPEPIRG
jgi:NAD(P)-dependent dehydrogenase (short-subunit alcohol dehydrogenase family)